MTRMLTLKFTEMLWPTEPGVLGIIKEYLSKKVTTWLLNSGYTNESLRQNRRLMYSLIQFNFHHTLNFYTCDLEHKGFGWTFSIEYFMNLLKRTHTLSLTELGLNWIMWRNSCPEGQRSMQAFGCLYQKQLGKRLEKRQREKENKRKRTHDRILGGRFPSELELR